MNNLLNNQRFNNIKFNRYIKVISTNSHSNKNIKDNNLLSISIKNKFN